MTDKKIKTGVSDWRFEFENRKPIELTYVSKEIEETTPDGSKVYIEAYISRDIVERVWELDMHLPATPDKISRSFLVFKNKDYSTSHEEVYDLTGHSITEISAGSWFNQGKAVLNKKNRKAEYFLRMTLEIDDCISGFARFEEWEEIDYVDGYVSDIFEVPVIKEEFKVIQYTPIICCHCDKDTGMFQENFTHLVLYHDVKCPHCSETIIYANLITC